MKTIDSLLQRRAEIYDRPMTVPRGTFYHDMARVLITCTGVIYMSRSMLHASNYDAMICPFILACINAWYESNGLNIDEYQIAILSRLEECLEAGDTSQCLSMISPYI